MKNVSLWSGALVVAAVVVACHTPSVQGIATPEHIEYDGGLLGRWFYEDGHLDVAQGERNRYLVTWTEEQGDEEEVSPELDVVMVRIGQHLVIDATLSEDELEEFSELEDGRYAAFLIPIHHLFRLDIEEGRLTLTHIEDDWLEEQLRRGRVDYYEVDKREILTAGPDELRDLLAEAFQTDGAMDDDDVLVLTRTREE